QAQKDTDLVHIRQRLDDARSSNQQRRLTLIIELPARRICYDQLRRPVELLLRECKCRLRLLERGDPSMQDGYLVLDILSRLFDLPGPAPGLCLDPAHRGPGRL